MARTKRKDGSSSTSGSHVKTPSTKKRKQVSQDREAFGEDPWTSISERSGAAGVNGGTHSFTAVNTPKDATARSLRVRFTSPPGIEEQQDASKATTKSAPKAVEETVEDDIAIPTPIHQTWEFKFETRDGRKGYCYQPISGFEHLFKAPVVSHETNDSSGASGASGASHMASQPHQAQAAVATQDHEFTYNSIDRQYTQRDASPTGKPPNPVQADPTASSSSNARKRTRAKAQGRLKIPKEPVKQVCIDQNSDADDDDVKVVTESSKTFLIGDIEGLKTFFRHRLDELTMKPVRGMVTRWVKQLEPKRKGAFGAYHKMLPTEAPKDATPPWWPQTVLYVEPAHLDKEALLTLAVDIALQHRDTRADELKRQQPWTRKLRQIAEAEVSLTDSEHFSSSKNPAFSSAMKERAEKELLPSLFDIMQSYEDFVNQYNLWTYSDLTKAPSGKSITWRAIPRPPTQTGFFKRPRPVQPREPPAVVKLEHDDDSGEDTEVDDTMVRLMRKKDIDIQQLMKNKNIEQFATAVATVIKQQEEAAQQKARAETARVMSVTSGTEVESIVATPRMTIKQVPATPHSDSPEVEDAKPTIGVPFQGSTTHLRVTNYDTLAQTNEGQAHIPQSVPENTTMHAQFGFDQGTPQHDENDMRRGSAMITATQVPMNRLAGPYLHSPQQFQTDLSTVREHQVASGRLIQFHSGDQHAAQQNDNPTLGALSNAGSFTSHDSSSFNSYEPAAFASYPTHTFNNDFSDLTVFNQRCPPRQSQPFFSPAITSQNISYGCSPDLLYTSMGSSMTNLPSQANQTFNGLPYDFADAQN